MKKTVALFMALVMSLALAACSSGGENPFDKVTEYGQKNFTFSNMVELFGENYNETGGSEHYRYEYSDYDFYGNKGTLSLSFDRKEYKYYWITGKSGYIDLSPEEAPFNDMEWKFDKGDLNKTQYEKVINTFIKKFDAEYGPNEPSEYGYHWKDKSGYTYYLSYYDDHQGFGIGVLKWNVY